MNSEFDPTLEDMIRASYRLSWPGTAPAPRPVHRLVGRVVRLCRRQTLQGWPVELSPPTA